VVDGSGNPIAGVTVSDNAGHTAVTGSDGRYTLSGLAAGTYTLTPSKSGYAFSPASRAVTVPPDATGVDFVGYQITIAHIEVSQATQTDTNSVPLIAMKSALVRVYLSSDSSVSFVEGITGRLTVIREEGSARTVVGSVPALNALKSIALFVFRTHDLDETLNFLVPASMMQGTVSFHVQVFQGEREVVGGESGPWSLERIRPPKVLVFRVACWDGSIANFTLNDLINAYALADRMLPLPRTFFELSPETFEFDCINGGELLLLRLSFFRLLSGGTYDYVLGVSPAAKFGWTSGEGSSLLRAAWVEDGILTGYTGGYLLAHEVGHVLDAPHLPNVEGSERPGFPIVCPPKDPANVTREWGDGQIKEYGVYVGRRPAGIPRTHPDVMTYCNWQKTDPQDDSGNPIVQWISPYSYQRMLSTLRSWSGLRAQGAAGARLLASGVVYTDGQAVLDPFWVLTPTGSVENPPAGTRYCLEILGEGDSRLAGHCFDLSFTDHFGEPTDSAGFLVQLPYPAGARRVVLREGTQVLAERRVSPGAPAVAVLSPAGGEQWPGAGQATLRWAGSDPDGDALTYTVLYSPDGVRWLPVGVDLTGTELTVDLGGLPGGSAARVRVMATDGVNTTVAESGAFGVGRKGPQAFILGLQEGQVLPPGAPVLLKGAAYDPEDGVLPDEALRWTSDRDGDLGVGGEVLARLSAGAHVLTLTAVDGDGNRATAAVRVFVGSRLYLPLVLRNR
jgi:hypothetical protein